MIPSEVILHNLQNYLQNRWAVAGILLAAIALVFAAESVLMWKLLTLIAAMVAAFEWARLVGQARQDAVVFTALFAVLVLLTETFLWEDNADGRGYFWGGVVLAWVLVLPWFVLLQKPLPPLLGLVCGLLSLYATWLAAVSLFEENIGMLMMGLAVVWVFDSVSYFVGRRLGRTPLAASISPKKTMEGAMGGIVAVFITAGMFVAVWGIDSQWLSLVWAVAFGAAMLALWGDLFESFLKRSAGVKDSGSCLGEHGGMLDRIDALIPVLPFVALFAKWLL